MYHCDIITEIFLTYLLHWFYFFREAIEPFALSFYIWGILLFGGIVLPHRVGGSCCCQRQPCSPSWFLSLFLDYYNYFSKKVFRAFQKKLVESFYTGVHDNLCPSVTPLWVLKLIALSGARRHLQSIYLCILCLCSSSFLSAEKLGKTSWHCQMLRGTNQKRMVSSVWRRKYCLRNLECFCGRALNNCRHKSHAADPTPGACSWRRRAEMVPAPLLACVEPGRAQVQHPVCGSWGCHCALLFLSPTWCDKGSSWWQSQCPLRVVRGKSAVS